MAVIGSDGLSLFVGDGAATESFMLLKGALVHRLEISQRMHAVDAVASDAWRVNAVTTGRQAMIECEGVGTDEAPAKRMRALSLNGTAGNFKLEVSATETVLFAAVVTLYRETIEVGALTRLQCRLESSGALTVA